MEEAIKLIKAKIENLELRSQIPYQTKETYDEINFCIVELEDLLFKLENSKNK